MYSNVNINIEIIIANLGKSNTANYISYPQVRPRVLGVVFGVHLSAQSRVLRIDPEESGQSPTAYILERWV